MSVAINNWYGPFYDLIQAALSKSRPVDIWEFYNSLATFAGIAFVAVTVVRRSPASSSATTSSAGAPR